MKTSSIIYDNYIDVKKDSAKRNNYFLPPLE